MQKIRTIWGFAALTPWLLLACQVDNSGPTDSPGFNLGPPPGGTNPPPPGTNPPPTNANLLAASNVNQDALAGAEVVAPRVQVLDASGNPASGVEVIFVVSDGVIENETDVTDADGFASAGTWFLEKRIGTNMVTAELNDEFVEFRAVARSDYAIELEFIGDLSNAQEEAFARASDRWSGVIINDLPDVQVMASTLLDACGLEADSSSVQIDDLLIVAEVLSIDGPGGILGQAGPCLARSGDASPVAGIMEFDGDDLDRLESNGQLEVVILHEMGHVLGIGTTWEIENLLNNPSVPSNPGADTHFNGAGARAAFDRVGGFNFDDGEIVPVENNAVEGSADGHWREAVFREELMTPGIAPSELSSALSEVTAESLSDLGYYTVNLDATDPYTLPGFGGRVIETPVERLDCRLISPGVFVD